VHALVLEGEQGLFPAMAPEADPEAVLTPADGWRIHEVSFKPHAACRHAHPAIDAALAEWDARKAKEAVNA
jgi:2-methylcitrate dehydratase PrpD